MASQVEVPAPGEFIASEANGDRSRENIIVASGAGIVPAGRIMGKVTAGGKCVQLASGLANGGQNFFGVLYAQVDATSADAPGVVMARDCELVNARVTALTPADKSVALVASMVTAGVILR